MITGLTGAPLTGRPADDARGNSYLAGRVQLFLAEKEFAGAVAYVEAGMGFSVKFEKINRAHYGALHPLLGEPGPDDVED